MLRRCLELSFAGYVDEEPEAGLEDAPCEQEAAKGGRGVLGKTKGYVEDAERRDQA